jgi:hypothetical protein
MPEVAWDTNCAPMQLGLASQAAAHAGTAGWTTHAHVRHALYTHYINQGYVHAYVYQGTCFCHHHHHTSPHTPSTSQPPASQPHTW